MNTFIFKVYKGTRELVYMTFNLDNAIKKYFIYTRNDSFIEVWKGQEFVCEYHENRYDLKAIRADIENITNVA